jgi:hypothetical protein
MNRLNMDEVDEGILNGSDRGAVPPRGGRPVLSCPVLYKYSTRTGR